MRIQKIKLCQGKKVQENFNRKILLILKLIEKGVIRKMRNKKKKVKSNTIKITLHKKKTVWKSKAIFTFPGKATKANKGWDRPSLYFIACCFNFKRKKSKAEIGHTSFFALQL